MSKSLRDIVSQVLDANDVVDVLGGYLELKPSGSRHKALCPFHTEKTPSFVVTRSSGTFHCFGCGKHGDAITFLQEYEGLTFSESLQKLADRAGISLPKVSGRGKGEDEERKRQLALAKAAGKFFESALSNPMGGEAGRGYLKTRALRDETIRRFGLGYAPDGGNGLTNHLRSKGFDEAAMVGSGLVRRNPDRGHLYDFFRHRVMFPIRDVAGNVVAFGGRDLQGDQPKYINSPENAVYKKSRVLYGLYEAREGLRKEQRAVLVEGYFDVLRCFDAGIETALAPCGTALTDGQAALIRRYVPEVLLVFDGDAQGIKAALRGVSVLMKAGLTVRALTLPESQDPDDFIRERGAEAFRALADEAQDVVTFYVGMSSERTGTIEGRVAVARELFGILADLDDELRRGEYLKQVAEALHLDPWSCQRDFADYMREQSHRAAALESRAEEPRLRVNPHDSELVAMLLARPERVGDFVRLMVEYDGGNGPVEEVIRWLEGSPGGGVHGLESEGARALYTAGTNLDLPDGIDAEAVLLERLAGLKRAALRRQAAQLQEEIVEAQRLNNDAVTFELVRRKIIIEQEIRA